MSDYSSLKATINANIKANNNHEITGAITNSVLNAMVDSLGAGYQFMGVATPTNPGTAQTPDYKCFYLATTPGTYTNLGGLVVAEGEVAILKYDTAWTKEVTGVATADQLNQLGQDVKHEFNQVRGENIINTENITIGGDNPIVLTFTGLNIKQGDNIEIKVTSNNAWTDLRAFSGMSASDWATSSDKITGITKNTVIRHTAVDDIDNICFWLVNPASVISLSIELKQNYYGGIKELSDNLVELDETVCLSSKLLNKKQEDITLETEYNSHVIDGTTGAMLYVSDTSKNYWVSAAVEIHNYNGLIVSASSMSRYAYYAFYAENGTFIEAERSATGFDIQKITNKVISIPEGAYFIRLACITDSVDTDEFALSTAQITIIGANKWADKKWGLIGDSITEQNSRSSIHYYDYIKQVTGITFSNVAVSGSGYKRSVNYFMTQIPNLPQNLDVITIMGSVNDYAAGLPIGEATDTGNTTLCGYINQTISAIRSAYPTTPFGIITPTPVYEATLPDLPAWMRDYSAKIVEVCALRSVPCLDLFNNSNLYPDDATFRTLAYSHDDGNGTHPDEMGHKIIAPRIKQFLESIIMLNP